MTEIIKFSTLVIEQDTFTEETSLHRRTVHDVKRDVTTSLPRDQWLFQELPYLHEVITSSIIFCVGLVLNALILRCYWSVKTSTAVYIRVLAAYDVMVLTFNLAIKILTGIFLISKLSVIEQVRELIGRLLMSNAMLGPLFMALDRILIVAFPHSFKKHEKKMRITKISIAILQNVAAVTWNVLVISFGQTSPFVKFGVALSTAIFVMQFVACVFLYAFIVWKVRASTRKVRPVTQAGLP